jgi:tungstate transport system substrate-binding protein
MSRANVFLFVLLALLAAFAGNARAEEGTLVLATTTSTENSGLLAYLHPEFERQTGIRVKVVAKGTGASLQLARDGNADVVLVHAREKEEEFIENGHGVMRRDVMFNDFVLLGPSRDPAGIQGMEDPAKALRKIAGQQAAFVSRGDNSGTHIREQQLWQRTNLPLEKEQIEMTLAGKSKAFSYVRPPGDWYWSIGQGMGKTILVTTEKRAYTLADRGTYYAFSLASPPRTDLVILCEGHESLFNPYGVIAVNPQKHPHVNFDGARAYIQWITSPATQKKIGQYRFQGKTLFVPNAKPADE